MLNSGKQQIAGILHPFAVTDGHLYGFVAKLKRGAEKEVDEFFDSVHLLVIPE